MDDKRPERSPQRRLRGRKESKGSTGDPSRESGSNAATSSNFTFQPRRTDRSPPLKGSPPRRVPRKVSKNIVISTTTSDPALEDEEDLLLPELVESDSPLLRLPHELLMRVLGFLTPRTLEQTGDCCSYLRAVSELVWMRHCKDLYPQYTSRDWRILIRRLGHSTSLLNAALTRSPSPTHRGAVPPSLPWHFLYHHTNTVRFRNWLAPRDATWNVNFTPLRPVLSSPGGNGSRTALHQYHLFPTCMTADSDLLVCGSGCYETVADPTTLMIGPRVLQLFDVSTGNIVKTIPAHPSSILDVQLDANYIYSCSIDRTIAMWDRTSGEHVASLYGHSKAIYQILLYDNLLISAGKDKTIRFWDPSQRENALTPPPFVAPPVPNPVTVTYGVEKDGITALQPKDNANLTGGSRALKSVILAHEGSVRRFAVSDRALLSVSGDSQACYWDIETQTLIRPFAAIEDAVALDVLHSDAVIASANGVQHFDLRTSCAKPVRQSIDGYARHLQLDSCKLLMGDNKGLMHIWDWNVFREVYSFRAVKHRCSFHYDHSSEKLFVGGSDKFVKLYDFSTRPLDLSPSTQQKKCSIM